MPSLEVDYSGRMQALARLDHVTYEADPEAFFALAADLRSEVPDEARLVVLYGDEPFHTPDASILAMSEPAYYLPTVTGEDDLIVRHRGRVLDEAGLTTSVAQALADRRRGATNDRAVQAGKLLMGGGFVVGLAGEAGLRNSAVSSVGLAAFIAGISLTAYFANRGAAPLPDVADAAPPIRLVRGEADG